MKTKYFFATVKAINEQARTIDAVASTSDLDRDNDIILPNAFTESLPSFKANPVILATHQHRLSTGSSPVIGSALPESIKVTDKEVLFTMGFANTKLGEEYWQLYLDKHMRAFSIGFIPIEWEDKKDEQVGYIRTYTKIELLEISAVPVPSNRRALARAKGYFDDDNTEEIVTQAVKAVMDQQFSEQFDKFIVSVDDHFDEIKSILIAGSDGFAESLLGNSSDSSIPAGDNDFEKAERQLKRIEKSFYGG